MRAPAAHSVTRRSQSFQRTHTVDHRIRIWRFSGRVRSPSCSACERRTLVKSRSCYPLNPNSNSTARTDAMMATKCNDKISVDITTSLGLVCAAPEWHHPTSPSGDLGASQSGSSRTPRRALGLHGAFAFTTTAPHPLELNFIRCPSGGQA